MTTAKTWLDMAAGVICYDWLYVPLCKWLDTEPWAPSGQGVLLLVLAAIAWTVSSFARA
jgi:hypothetical protein